MSDRKCPLGHDRETNCPYHSCELAQSCMAPEMKVGRLDGFEIVLSEPAGGNRHERRAHEARRRKNG